jgi:XapX domain-containing protein
MKPYLVCLAVGVLVGALYALLRVRSPAPPVIALVGLLGMLIGEQGVGLAFAAMPGSARTTSAVVIPSKSTPSNNPAENSHAP